MMSSSASPEAEGELGRWLTLERIAHSDFMMMLFVGLKSESWDAKQAAQLSEAALTVFANGCCFYLASAIASTTRWPIVGFWRKNGNPALVHAVISDPVSGYGLDIVGRRPIADIRDELAAAVGPVRTKTIPSIHEEMDQDELACLIHIASGLAWMPQNDEAIAPDAWAELMLGYASANAARRASDIQ